MTWECKVLPILCLFQYQEQRTTTLVVNLVPVHIRYEKLTIFYSYVFLFTRVSFHSNQMHQFDLHAVEYVLFGQNFKKKR